MAIWEEYRMPKCERSSAFRYSYAPDHLYVYVYVYVYVHVYVYVYVHVQSDTKNENFWKTQQKLKKS